MKSNMNLYKANIRQLIPAAIIICLMVYFTIFAPMKAYGATDWNYEEALKHNQEVIKSFSTEEIVLQYYKKPSSFIQSDDPAIIEQTNKIISGKTTDEEKAKAIHKWIVSNIKYDHDLIKDFGSGDGDPSRPQTAASVLKDRKGVCLGFSHLMIAMLRASDIPSTFVSVDGHVMVASYINNRWIIIEPQDVNYYDISLPLLTETLGPISLEHDLPTIIEDLLNQVRDTKVVVNGVIVPMMDEPVLIDGVMMVQAGALVKAMDGKVIQNNDKNKFSFEKGNKK